MNHSFFQDLGIWVRLIPGFRRTLIKKVQSLEPISRFRLFGYDDFLFSIGSEASIDAHILVLGGYRGSTTRRWLEQGAKSVTVFEPVTAFFRDLTELFETDQRVMLVNAAAGATSEPISIGIQGDESSTETIFSGQLRETVSQINFSSWLRDQSVFFGVTEINIEGGEYALFESLEATDVRRLGVIFIQTHIVEDLDYQLDRLDRKISISHFRVLNLPLVWDVWVPRSVWNA